MWCTKDANVIHIHMRASQKIKRRMVEIFTLRRHRNLNVVQTVQSYTKQTKQTV